MNSILITGGCGFIGSNIINTFLKRYKTIKIVNVDKLYFCASKKNIDNSCVSLIDDNYFFINEDINNLEKMKEILEIYNIDTVLHLAAQSHVDNSFSNPLQFTYDNVKGTHTLLEACRLYRDKYPDKLKLFVHVSTDEVYGGVTFNELNNENTLLCPTNPYSASKAGAEMLAMSYYYSYKLPIIITRGNNVYGKNQYPEKLIPRMIELLKRDRKCTIHGTGEVIRNFINVNDTVDAFDCIIKKGKTGEIYNIGCEDEFRVIDIVKLIIKYIKNTTDYDRYIEYVEDRKFNDKRYHIVYNKLKDLGWRQRVSFEDGIKEVIDYHLKLNCEEHWDLSKNPDLNLN